MTTPGVSTTATEQAASEPGVLDMLALETIEENLYRAGLVRDEDHALYGGQVAAQALRAAGLTVGPGRRAHSLHGYFLRKGDARRPTVYQVFRDRDGGSFSARRVVAIQRGEVIFSMSASFQAPHETWGAQAEPMPGTEPPEESRAGGLHRLLSVEARYPVQPFAGRTPIATRFWARCTADLPADPLLHACVLTYLSDISTAIMPAPDGSARPGPSLDHAIWFHGPADLTDWVLLDHQPRVSGHGRGWYTGSIFSRDGVLVASLAQEQLFR